MGATQPPVESATGLPVPVGALAAAAGRRDPRRRFEVVAPHLRRLNARLRGFPPAAKVLDRVGAGWAALVEAFCQTIEPLLERRFPDLRLVAVAGSTGALAMHRVGRDGATPLGELAAIAPEAQARLAATRWSAIELQLPPTQILERRLSLPAASREFLAPILEHRLDRLTPWRPDRVLYGFRTMQEEHATGTAAGSVAVTLTATSRDLVAAPLQRLGAAGLVPTAIGGDSGSPKLPLAVNLLGGGTLMPPRAESRRFVSKAALTVGSALLVAWIATALIDAAATADQAASTKTLLKARRLLRAASVGNVGSREQAMLQAKQPGRSTVMLIDQLATSIPADTYLKELTIQPDKVRLVGSSGNAPALIGRLEAAGLSNVRFTSTIARDRAGRDSFELGADRPQPKPEEAP